VAVIDSHGKNVPDYASIVPSAFFKGVVVDAYDYHTSQGDQLTYEAFRHKVRLWLAGRAAEEMYLGALQVSNGSRGDLDKATDFACDGFGLWGFAPSMDEAGKSGSNLTVAVDKSTAFDVERVHGLVREFLATEYAVVMKMLVEHRAFVDAIAERLLWDPILDQKTLTEMAEEHGATGVVASGAAAVAGSPSALSCLSAVC
jgi:ATP-dependent Zn protease